MDEDRGLCKIPVGKDWLWGRLALALFGQGHAQTLAHWKKRYDKPRQHVKKQKHYLIDRGPYSQIYVF